MKVWTLLYILKIRYYEQFVSTNLATQIKYKHFSKVQLTKTKQEKKLDNNISIN